MRIRLLLSLVFVTVSISGLASAPLAAAEPVQASEVWVQCNPGTREGSTIEEQCKVTVWNAFPEPRIPPTGTVTINGTTSCVLVPIDLVSSSCTYTVMAPIGQAFDINFEYPGDETHRGTQGMEGWDYPPGDFSWAPPPPIPLPYPNYHVASTPSQASTAGPGPGASTERASLPKITHGPAKRTRSHLASFRFAGGSAFECALDLGRFRACSRHYSRHVSTGRHVLRLRLTGGDGDLAVFRWRVLSRRRD